MHAVTPSSSTSLALKAEENDPDYFFACTSVRAMLYRSKAFLNLDGAVRVLSPELDPVQLIRDYMLQVMEKRIESQLTPGRIFAWVLDMKHLFENAPRRTDMVLDKLANDQLTVRLEVEHVDDVVKSLNRAANRLSLSMLLASLVIGGGFLLEALRKTRR